jgi:AbiV family abortive infection protein
MEKEFINGIYLSYQNSKDLYEEAQILEKYQKTSRAYCLYHLSLEECGRFHMIYNFLFEYIEGEIKGKDFNYGKLRKRGYEDHQLKIKENFDGIFKITYITLALSKQNIDPKSFQEHFKEEIEEITKTYEAILEIKKELNDLKNKSLYLTYHNNKFVLPDHSIMTSDFFRIKELTTLSLKAIQKTLDFIEAKGGFDKLREHLKNGT